MEIGNPKAAFQLKFDREWPTAVAFVGSRRRLAAGNRSGEILFWELPETPPEPGPTDKEPEPADVPPARRLDGHANGISHLRASADGKLLISASLDRTIRLWDVAAAPTGKAEIILDLKDREQKARNQSGDKKKAILEAPGQTVETIQAEHVLEGHRDWVTALAFDAENQRLMSGDDSSLIIVWDLATRGPVSQWMGHLWNSAAAVALSPDGQTALVSEYRYKRDDFDIPSPALKLWSVLDGKEVRDYLKIQFPKFDPVATSYEKAQVWRKFVAGGLIAVDFSPDGKLFAVGQGGETDTGEVHLLETESGKLVRTLSGHRYGVCDVRFSADGKHILSSGRDTMVRICQVADGKQVLALGKERGGQFKDWLHAIALSPDEKSLAAADIAGMVHIWDL